MQLESIEVTHFRNLSGKISWGPHLNIIAGKIPWSIGAFGSRALSSENPLVGRPLLYQHHTTLSWYAA